MDLGCMDLGCISSSDEKKISANSSAEKRTGETSDSSSATAKFGKNKSPKGSPPSGVNALNKFTSQIRKPPHRKASPLNWFPRKKAESYLKRKIKLLQEAGGMNDTLDETLGHTNPHYCRVEREKIAAREAACKVMEARKAAMVEASWCRILQAARIPTKEADALLLNAEKEVDEAFEAAKAEGVIMYDTPDCPWKHFEIETSSVNGKGSTTHTVKAAFETAFEVDKQVAAAVKAAFVRLAHCPSFKKDEFKDLLRKISENPESHDMSESDTGSEFEKTLQDDDDDGITSERRQKKKLSSQKFNTTKLVEMMLERLKCLKEEELASLATIVATCGLNAALANTESCNKAPNKISATKIDYSVKGVLKNQVEPELPSLDKFLVKKMTKLEREVQEARNARRAESNKKDEGNLNNSQHCCSRDGDDEKPISTYEIPDLGSVLLKHSSKLEKEVEDARRSQKVLEMNMPKLEKAQRHRSRLVKQESAEVPSLDKLLVKHVTRLEREMQEAKSRRRNDVTVAGGGHLNLSISGEEQREKENVDSNKSVPLEQKECDTLPENIDQESGLDKIMVKPLHRLERYKMQGKESGNWVYKKHQRKTNDVEGESLDKVLVKHASRLEKEKMGVGDKEVLEVKKKISTSHSDTTVGGLDQILVKHKSKLEREKAFASQQPEEGSTYTMSRRAARERELLEMWGGIGLGHSMQPRVSRLEREKAAWLKAEEEERKGALLEQ